MFAALWTRGCNTVACFHNNSLIAQASCLRLISQQTDISKSWHGRMLLGHVAVYVQMAHSKGDPWKIRAVCWQGTSQRRGDDGHAKIVLAPTCFKAPCIYHRHDPPRGFTQIHCDTSSYTWRQTSSHNVIIASLPVGLYGMRFSAITTSNILSSLPYIQIGLSGNMWRYRATSLPK